MCPGGGGMVLAPGFKYLCGSRERIYSPSLSFLHCKMGIMVLFVPVPQDMKGVHLQMRWPLQSIREAPFRLGKQGHNSGKQSERLCPPPFYVLGSFRD